MTSPCSERGKMQWKCILVARNNWRQLRGFNERILNVFRQKQMKQVWIWYMLRMWFFKSTSHSCSLTGGGKNLMRMSVRQTSFSLLSSSKTYELNFSAGVWFIAYTPGVHFYSMYRNSHLLVSGVRETMVGLLWVCYIFTLTVKCS